jgi:hypothetical protein
VLIRGGYGLGAVFDEWKSKLKEQGKEKSVVTEEGVGRIFSCWTNSFS